MTHHHDHDHLHDHDHNHLEEEKDYITIVDEEGNESLYEILFTFDSEDFGKSYVVIFPAGSSEDDEVEIQVYSYVEDEGGLEGNLNPVESDEEWEMIEEVINTFIEDEEA